MHTDIVELFSTRLANSKYTRHKIRTQERTLTRFGGYPVAMNAEFYGQDSILAFSSSFKPYDII